MVRRQDQIAFVFTVFFVHQDDDATGFHFGHDLFNGGDRHGGQLLGGVHGVSFWIRPALSMRST